VWAPADDDAPARPAAPPPAFLRITRQGRPDIALHVTGTRIEGHARGAAVSLELEGSRLHGKIGDQPLSLFAARSQASGSIAAEETGFGLAATEGGGAIVRGGVPGHTVRIELASGHLSWYPGCDQPLPQRGAGVYQGACADGTQATVTIPGALTSWPELPRLIVLGILLTEPDPLLPPATRALFPPTRR
jgi:hypothetical protein